MPRRFCTSSPSLLASWLFRSLSLSLAFYSPLVFFSNWLLSWPTSLVRVYLCWIKAFYALSKWVCYVRRCSIDLFLMFGAPMKGSSDLQSGHLYPKKVKTPIVNKLVLLCCVIINFMVQLRWKTCLPSQEKVTVDPWSISSQHILHSFTWSI